MPAPKKRQTSKNSKPKPEQTKSTTANKLQISVAVPSLSGLDEETSARVIAEVKSSISNSINDVELQRALEKWIKENHTESTIVQRDYHLLKSVITEYLDSYILFGYNTDGERIIVQHANTARDRDAVMEFLKTIFIQQQQTNFLDTEEGDDLDQYDG